VGPRGYQTGHHFYDESSIITIWNENSSRIDFITYHIALVGKIN
jgi:hypothetical protein